MLTTSPNRRGFLTVLAAAALAPLAKLLPGPKPEPETLTIISDGPELMRFPRLTGVHVQHVAEFGFYRVTYEFDNQGLPTIEELIEHVNRPATLDWRRGRLLPAPTAKVNESRLV